MNVHRSSDGFDGLPRWLSTTVVLGLLGLFGYNLIVYGPDGYPTSVIIGGLLGGYAGVDQLLKRKRRSDGDPPPGGGPSE